MCRYANNTLIVIDEAHHSSYAAPIFSSVISRFPRAIGLTATPWTNRLINLFDQTYFYSLTEAISNCVVSPIEIIRMPTFAPGCNSPAIIFVATNDEAKLKSEKHVHADWIGHSRDVSTNFAVLNCWKSGQIRTLFVNRMLLEGYDLPDLETVWIDMKIKSHVMCAQIIGRALRYRQGKRARIFVLSDESESTAREALAMIAGN
jgi:superfamily II DNA or RNA helicase